MCLNSMESLVAATLGFLLCCTAVAALNTDGLNPQLLPLYQSKIRGDKFCCLDGSRCVGTDNINDDFCDCNDGSDEFGTSACAHQSDKADAIKFWCRNEGFHGMEIPRWKVNDGICDCCDGSDEAPTAALKDQRTNKCKNTCAEIGRVWREEMEKTKREQESGRQRAIELGAEGQKTRKEWERKKEELTTKRIPELKQQIKELKRKLSSLEDRKKAEEEEKSNVTTAQATTDEAQEKETTTSSPKPGDETRAAEAAGDEKVDKGDMVSEYTQWMEKEEEGKKKEEKEEKRALGIDDDLEEDRDDIQDLDDEDEKEREELEGRTTTIKPSGGKDNTELANNATADARDVASSPWSVRVRRWIGTMWNKHFGLDSNISSLSAQIKELERSLYKLGVEAGDLEKKLQLQQGRQYDQFIPFMGNCVFKAVDRFIYEICLIDKATQKDGGSSNNLGSFSELVTTNDDGSPMVDSVVMKFSGGAYCWKGPNRAMTATVTCWSSNEIVSVVEPEPCVYTATMRSPAACSQSAPQSEAGTQVAPEEL